MATQKGEKRGPYKQGHFREMLEKYVFESEAKFATWVEENYTDAIKELGKLQPKPLTIQGDENGGPVKLTVERKIVEPTNTTSGGVSATPRTK